MTPKRIVNSLALVGVMCSCLMLSGCWSAVAIQNQSYPKAIAVDYEDGKFIVYIQVLDFSNIAKSESGGKANEEALVWVGKGKGDTVTGAVANIYNTSQFRVAWGHVTAIIFSEKLLKEKGIEVVDMVVRYPEIRYNAWVFGSKSPLDKLLSTTPFFKMAPIYSIMHDPMDNYKQNSVLPPQLLFKYNALLNEPSATAYLPSIGINETQWTEAEKNKPQLILDGAFFDYGGKTKGFLPRNKLNGYRWLNKQTNRTQITVKQDGTIYSQLAIHKPSIKITPVLSGSDVRFRIKASYLGEMTEYITPVPYEKMISISEEIIKQQIMQTYDAGLSMGMDIYQLGHHVRKRDPALWRKLSNNGEKLIIHSESIESLQIKVRIPYSGKYKRQI